MRTNVSNFLFVFLAIIMLPWCTAKVDDSESALMQVKQKYDSLSPKGKFAAGCTLGFVGSRIAVNTAVSCMKIGVAAFVT
jgi:hypothetical protein